MLLQLERLEGGVTAAYGRGLSEGVFTSETLTKRIGHDIFSEMIPDESLTYVSMVRGAEETTSAVNERTSTANQEQALTGSAREGC